MTRYLNREYAEAMEGGKLNLGKSFKKMGSTVKKEFTRPARKALQDAGIKLGEITNKELLPGAVSIGIPVAAQSLGMLGAMYGIPPEITANMTQNLLESYIPEQYQSNNPYINMFGDALSMGIGGPDPYSSMQLSQQMLGTMGNQMGGEYHQGMPLSSSKHYNPDNPYQDILLQMMKSKFGKPGKPIKPSTISAPIDTNPNDDNDALYKSGKLDETADNLQVTTPPYQQREGSSTGLLGAGAGPSVARRNAEMREREEMQRLYDEVINQMTIDFIRRHTGDPGQTTSSEENVIELTIDDDEKEGRGLRKKRKPKKKIEQIEIYVKKKPSYMKFTHGKNKALDQLLEATAERDEKEAKKAMKNLIGKQTQKLISEGYGLSNILNKIRGRGRNVDSDDDDEEISSIMNNMAIKDDEKGTFRVITKNKNIPKYPYRVDEEKETGKRGLPAPSSSPDSKKGRGLGRPKKGSVEAKERMAKLRAMKKK